VADAIPSVHNGFKLLSARPWLRVTGYAEQRRLHNESGISLRSGIHRRFGPVFWHRNTLRPDSLKLTHNVAIIASTEISPRIEIDVLTD
jgi:hypothetical protein